MRKAAFILITVIATVVVGLRLLGANAKENTSTVIIHPAFLFQIASTRSLHCARLIAAPIIDGQVSDWPAVDSIDLNRNTAYSFSGRIDNPNDLSAIIRSGWDNNALYFAIQVKDDIVMADSTDVWRDDGVEIGLDGLRDQYAWGWDDHQYTIVVDGRVTDRGVPTTDIRAAVLGTTDGYNIEVAIPISKLLPGIPISGTVMGFTVGLHDDDDGGNWDAYFIWEGTTTSSRPELFGSLIFTERPEDRMAALEAKIIELERKIQELLRILKEFEQLTPP
ncbi:MAG: sugar-binding protein [Anaerolineae bacterium]